MQRRFQSTSGQRKITLLGVFLAARGPFQGAF